MPDQQSRLNQFMDEASIRNVIARFADSATSGDYDANRTTWADDGEFIIGEGPQMQSATGADEAVAMLRRLRTGRDFFVMFALPGVIEINGNEATTRTLCHESARGPGEKYYRNHCVGFDRLRRSGDDWVLARYVAVRREWLRALSRQSRSLAMAVWEPIKAANPRAIPRALNPAACNGIGCFGAWPVGAAAKLSIRISQKGTIL